MALVFEGAAARALADPAEVTARDDGYRAVAGGSLELHFAPLSPAVELEGARVRVCGVRGSVGSAALDCLGTVTETSTPPRWSELDAFRAVSAVFDPEHAVLAAVRRPRGALGHGQEEACAWLLAGGELVRVEETRLSTVYDGAGRQRSAGLELWLAGEDFPRRASGTAVAGTSLELEGLVANVAAFEWWMDGRRGGGLYELIVRDWPREAA